MRNCLIVSPHFPPSTLAGVHRARHLAKHLPTHGWRPTVICVDPRFHIEKLDQELARLVPSSAEVVRVGAIAVSLTRPFGIAGDIGLRGYFQLRAAVAREMARERVDAILITGSPYYPMLMAGWIKRRWNVPVVLDFQDPWVSHVGADEPRLSKAGISHRLAVTLEPHAVRNAAFITSVSERQNEEMVARYSWLDGTRMADIPIGGDPEDFDALRTGTFVNPDVSPHLKTGAVNFSYVGTIWPPVLNTLRAVLLAVAVLRKKAPKVSSALRFNFVGTSANPATGQNYRVMPLAREFGVEDCVYEKPERKPYLEALQLMAQTEFSLLIGSHEPHYAASKTYPALMAGRPFLSIFHRMSSSHKILTRAGGGLALAFESPGQLESLVPAIAEGIERLASDPSVFGKVDPTAYEPYTAHAVAGRFADVFERAAERRHLNN